MSTDPVLIAVNGPVARVTINNPAQRGALSYDVMVALRRAFEHLGDRRDVRCIVLASQGEFFSSGHNLREMESEDESWIQQYFTASADMMLAMRRAPQPVVARVHASTAAAGCQLIAGAELAVSVADAKFSVAGPKIGQFPNLPAVAMLRTCSHKQLMRLYLTGEMIDAHEALRMGLVSHVVDATELDATIDAITEAICGYSGHVISEGLATFFDLAEMPSEEAAYRRAVQGVVDITLHADGQEGIRAFLEKRPPQWRHR